MGLEFLPDRQNKWNMESELKKMAKMIEKNDIFANSLLKDIEDRWRGRISICIAEFEDFVEYIEERNK